MTAILESRPVRDCSLSSSCQSAQVANMYVIPIRTLISQRTVHAAGSEPVVGGNGSSVLHTLPLRPRLDTIRPGIPDSLAPDDIFETESGTVTHYPFGNGLSCGCPHLRDDISSSHDQRMETERLILTPPADEHIISVASPQQ